ncbi:3-oxoacyl-ACP reductase FabG [Asaia astilbis]|uniref:3-oxoacyl-ACP reductase FabG n=1 Tax=Asaia astilbis TaxID=610244 RepID=UPI00046EA7F2|nr:3-oxoacyl-ACP reductase FabG [Asaia astilbis]
MRRALITGASGDIGAAIARRLAEVGMHVILHANSRREKTDDLATSLISEGHSAEVIQFDLTHRDNTVEALTVLLTRGPIQIVVNNAGIHDDAVLPGMRAEQWHRVIDVSLNGFFNVTQPLLMPMIRTRWGRIINVSSVAAVMGNRGQSNYAAAKAGLHGATRSLSLELGSRGITVNTVAPGVIEGEMADKQFDKARIASLVPMGRAGKPREVADLVAFLASDQAAYITGQLLNINGGMA